MHSWKTTEADAYARITWVNYTISIWVFATFQPRCAFYAYFVAKMFKIAIAIFEIMRAQGYQIWYSQCIIRPSHKDKDKYKDKDEDKVKVQKILNMCYIFEKQRVQVYQIWHFYHAAADEDKDDKVDKDDKDDKDDKVDKVDKVDTLDTFDTLDFLVILDT